MKTLRVALLAITLAVLAAACVVQVQSGNAGDKNWLLLAARMWLQGKKLYVDIFELDPPFIVWLYALPEWLALHMGVLPDFEWLALTGLVGCAFSIALSVALIRRHPAFAAKAEDQGYFALLLAAIFVFFTTQVYFFDREHIFFVLTFPYMLRFMPSLAAQKPGMAIRVAIAVLAAIGFCVKPYTILVFLVLQALYIARERRPTILYSFENAIIYASGAVYLLCVYYFTPEYIATVMPMALATYSGFSRRINGLLYVSLAFISAGLTFVDCRLRHRTPYRRDAYYFIGVCLAYLLYALANNGWGYTYNPLLCMLLFCSGWMLWDYGWLKREATEQGTNGRAFNFARRGCIFNLMLNSTYMLLCIGFFFTSARCDRYEECGHNSRFSDYMRENHFTSFGTIAVNLRQWTALARASGAAWNTRFHTLWMLPALMQGDADFRRRYQWIHDYVGEGLAQDLTTRKPEVVFVDRSDGIFGYPHPVDMVAYFSTSPAFARAWQNYRYQFTIDQCDPPESKKDENLQKTDVTAKKAIAIDCRFAVYRRNR